MKYITLDNFLIRCHEQVPGNRCKSGDGQNLYKHLVISGFHVDGSKHSYFLHSRGRMPHHQIDLTRVMIIMAKIMEALTHQPTAILFLTLRIGILH